MNSGPHWVFGYGSLIWRPGFEFEERADAVLRGYHRDMCITSVVHRGTPEVPGLVSGLKPGGLCHGRAYRVADGIWAEVLAYLDARELVNDVYLRIRRDVELVGGEIISAWCYVADTSHHQYAGDLPEDQRVRLLSQGIGPEGSSIDYLKGIVAHLDALKLDDPVLHRLLKLAESDAEQSP